MVRYTKEEITSSTQIARNIGDFLNKIRDNEIDKVAIMRNNKMEAVLLSIEEYENIAKLKEYIEQIELAKLIKNRKHNSKDEYVSFEDILEKEGISENEL